MSSGLVLLMVVAVGYLAARIVVDHVAHRFLIISGAEYLVLGVLLGPQVADLISANVVDAFSPFMMLAMGWTGTVVGARLHLPSLLRVRAVFFQTAFLQSIFALVVVAGLMTGALWWFLDVSPRNAIVPGLVLAAVATASSLTGVALATRRVEASAIVRQLHIATGMDAVIAILCFGILLCVVHPAPPGDVRAPTPTEWAVIAIAIGGVGGTVYHLFLGRERDADRLFITLAAAITLASGVAAFVRLSPLLPCMIIGAILVNTSSGRHEIVQVLNRIQRPLYLVLLIFAGAAWRPGERASIAIIALFIVARTFAKVGSARLAGRLGHMLGGLGPNWGRGLLGQGSLATAIALNYRIFDTSSLPDVVFSAAIASVVITDLFSARFARGAIRQQARTSRTEVPIETGAR